MKNKFLSRTLAKELWLKYDEPSLRWSGNLNLALNDIVIYSKEKMWKLVQAKNKFPQGQPELAGKRFPSNSFIEYILKVKTVFIWMGMVVVSNELTKEGKIRGRLTDKRPRGGKC